MSQPAGSDPLEPINTLAFSSNRVLRRDGMPWLKPQSSMLSRLSQMNLSDWKLHRRSRMPFRNVPLWTFLPRGINWCQGSSLTKERMWQRFWGLWIFKAPVFAWWSRTLHCRGSRKESDLSIQPLPRKEHSFWVRLPQPQLRRWRKLKWQPRGVEILCLMMTLWDFTSNPRREINQYLSPLGTLDPSATISSTTPRKFLISSRFVRSGCSFGTSLRDTSQKPDPATSLLTVLWSRYSSSLKQKGTVRRSVQPRGGDSWIPPFDQDKADIDAYKTLKPVNGAAVRVGHDDESLKSTFKDMEPLLETSPDGKVRSADASGWDLSVAAD